jgi:hypothetical protein
MVSFKIVLNAFKKNCCLLRYELFWTLSTRQYMTTLILLTPHSGGLEYDLNQNSKYSSKNHKNLVSTAATANLFGKNLVSTKALGLKNVH